MGGQQKMQGMLSPYRVLDLTDEKGLLCGKLLGDLGADVIKIERPGGDPARSIGPFYHDEIDTEKSLFWFAFNSSKRGITLDIETPDGQDTFKRLVKGADFVIESFPPGYMDKLGLGYEALEALNPGIIMASITPFGQTGPYKDFKTSDIVSWAMGGQMYLLGDEDRPPVRISHHSQAYCHASAEAAVGAMLALSHRVMTREGQHVDVSVQASVARLAYGATLPWDMLKEIWGRSRDIIRLNKDLKITRIWPCKDGQVLWFWFGGAQGYHNKPLVEWMESEGMADDYIREFDWEAFDLRTTTQDVLDRLEGPTRRFFMSHTKSELLEGAVEHHVILYPISTTADILESVQLAAREYWIELEHPELGAHITYPGAFVRSSEISPGPLRRAPRVGEHNKEIFEEELDISESQTGGRGMTPKRALEGIRVVEFCFFAAGPIGVKTLSDHGAEVIKIESQTRPDGQRWLPPHKDNIPGLERDGGYNQLNTGKRSVSLNLTTPKGIETAKRLIAMSDIVVENYSGGTIKRMGLGYEELIKVKPDIIMLSACMQGQTGPHASHPGYGPHLTALSGFTHIAGWPDRDGANLGVYTDFIAPHFIALAVLSALDYRRRTGRGQYIDMSQFEAVQHFMAPLLLDYAVNRRVADRTGNRHPYAVPHNAYPCRGEDRWCAISVFTDEEWQSLVKVMERPDWADDPRFATLEARKENEEELDSLIGEWTIKHPAEEVMDLLQAVGVAAGVLETGQEMLEHDPQFKHRRTFWELDHPEIGEYYSMGHAFVLSKSPCEVRRGPLLGEHNEYALKELLDMSDEEIEELVAEGVVE